MAQSGHGAGVGGQIWLAAVQKIKCHQVETGVVDRVYARDVRGNNRADKHDRWEAEVHAADGVVRSGKACGDDDPLSLFPFPNLCALAAGCHREGPRGVFW